MARGIGALAASVCMIALARPAHAQNVSFNIPAGRLQPALDLYTRQANARLLYRLEDVETKQTVGVRGAMPADRALLTLLQGSGLTIERAPSGAIGIVASAQTTGSASAPQTETASTADIVVTAQKRSERIQDVPIAISAFTQETLDKQKIEAGPDILKAVPNLTFSKSNFAGYNLSIRGIGTKAVSVTTDPGVAINFNSTTLITNRFFEQEFFDLERIEVLRGPQGTLYGRNATGGVVNIISNKADLTKFDGYLKAEVGNFGSRRAQGAINVPLVTDVLGLRLAGAYTNRDGFTTNDITMNRIDGRDLYTTRATLSFKPTSDIRSDLIWERFSENDSRARTAKQLCHRDPGNPIFDNPNLSAGAFALTSQGCKDGSLYDEGAYGVPNGLSLPYIFLGGADLVPLGTTSAGIGVNLLTQNTDPYASTTQTHDLRRISSVKDPRYRAKSNVYEFNTVWNLSDDFMVTAQTALNVDRYYSTQDYNRFNTAPVFNDSNGLTSPRDSGPAPNITPGGIYNDPQLGPSNRVVAQDLVTARSRQFSQELRLSTTSSGSFQGTVGANYTYYKNQTDYYVFINILSAALQSASPFVGNDSADPTLCRPRQVNGQPYSGPPVGTLPQSELNADCVYIDPNPLSSINGQGHNYFRSSNRFHANSYGIFGDGTYALTSTFKFIAGLRYNDDVKVSTPVPSQLLLGKRGILAGTVNYGYPEDPKIRQHFKAVTGRAGWQWFPKLNFTNDTMIYATYSRGYKAGGTNPPAVGFKDITNDGSSQTELLSYPETFKPEYVNSFEAGTKNQLFDKALTLNLTAYYYDFSNYQVSQIEDRQAINENFDTKMFGLEAETDWQITRALRVNANVGLQNAKLRKDQFSIDVIDRLQGHGDRFAVVKGFPSLPSNCVVSIEVIGGFPNLGNCPGSFLSAPLQYAREHPEIYPNSGRGFYANVGGNQVPNAPHFTVNLGAEYNIPFAGEWVLTPRVDGYHQSSSWARVYNDQIDRLRGWENFNVSIRAGNPELGLLIEAYVKNVFDSTPITDAFINSDDTGLTTNVFTFDPRIIGVNVTKKF